MSVPKLQEQNFRPDPSGSIAAQTRLQAILDAAVDAIIAIDANGVIESTNDTTEQMFGYREAELIGQNVNLLMPAPYRDKHDDYIQRYMNTRVPRIIGIGREVTALHRDGRTFPVDLAVNKFISDGKTMFIGMIRDVSDRRNAERKAQAHLEKLAHAGRLADLGLTTSTIAHEVNQPLTAIVSFAHACLRVLDNEPVKTDTLRTALEQIATQSERASTIVKRIHTMARKQHGAFDTIDINEIVSGVLTLLAVELRNQHVHLELYLTDTPAIINADRIQIEQVLVNLVRNGVQAMSETPITARRMEIETSTAGGRVCVRVHDSGPGLTEVEVLQIFESFYSTKDTGMGVGLSICRSLIDAHEGRLWALADPGNGATFCFELPHCS